MNIWKSIDIRARVAGLSISLIAMLAVAWWLGSPLFINQTVSESFPVVTPGVSKAEDTDTGVSGDAPVALSTGSFTEVDDIHKGSGTATIYTLLDGKRVLRFEDFQVTNGPDLFVYLSAHAQPRSAGELHGEGDFDLGRLKGNVGSQNYELPADLDLSKFKSVVIYCKQFSVVFSTATLVNVNSG
jgi:hypothetical protein